MTSVTVDGVSKLYYAASGSVQALQEVSLNVGSGEFVSLLGPSGCGKSTLLSIIAGLMPPTKGRVLIGEAEVAGPYTELGFVFQDSLLLDWRDALGNVMIQGEAKHLDPKACRDRAVELLESVGLKGFEKKRPWELSGGMRQRVSICRAFVHDPSLVLMDEPFGPLDALTREQLMLDLHRLWAETKKTVVFVTHSIAEAVFLSDRIVVMSPRPGRIWDIVDVDLGHPRDLDMQTSDAFARQTKQIYGMFQDMGLFAREEATAPLT